MLAIHDVQISEHGGLAGIRDLGLVRSVLSRPSNLAQHGKPSVSALAAAYAYGLSKNHGFVDGNKRTAYIVALVFLLDNGFEFVGEDADSVVTMLALASRKITEKQLSDWFQRNIRKTKE